MRVTGKQTTIRKSFLAATVVFFVGNLTLAASDAANSEVGQAVDRYLQSYREVAPVHGFLPIEAAPGWAAIAEVGKKPHVLFVDKESVLRVSLVRPLAPALRHGLDDSFEYYAIKMPFPKHRLSSDARDTKILYLELRTDETKTQLGVMHSNLLPGGAAAVSDYESVSVTPEETRELRGVSDKALGVVRARLKAAIQGKRKGKLPDAAKVADAPARFEKCLTLFQGASKPVDDGITALLRRELSQPASGIASAQTSAPKNAKTDAKTDTANAETSAE